MSARAICPRSTTWRSWSGPLPATRPRRTVESVNVKNTLILYINVAFLLFSSVALIVAFSRAGEYVLR